MIKFSEKIQQVNEYMKIAGGWEISRRYLVMNGFDGILTVLGVTLSAFLLGFKNPNYVIGTGISASIAIGVSGFWIAFLTEEAEQIRTRQHMEKILFTNLDHSRMTKAARTASYINSFIDGFSPFFFGSLSLVPFLLAHFDVFSISTAYYTSFTISAILLFVLGIFLGKISKRNVYIVGLKTTLAGIIVSILILTLGI